MSDVRARSRSRSPPASPPALKSPPPPKHSSSSWLRRPLLPRSRKADSSLCYTYWVPGVNHLGTYGRWAFAEFTEVYQIEADFNAKVESEFNKMLESATAQPALGNK